MAEPRGADIVGNSNEVDSLPWWGPFVLGSLIVLISAAILRSKRRAASLERISEI
jgi:hypothetical protein